MPFGLKGAPLTFQRTMNHLFGDLLGKEVYIYLDDIIVASKDITSHMATLRLVLDRLKEVGLKIKLTKCEFLKQKIKFLGHMVDELGIHTVDNKIAVSHFFPQPKSVDNVRSFLGLAGYYHPFIRNSAAIANPLTKLLKKDTPFEWSRRKLQPAKGGPYKSSYTCFSTIYGSVPLVYGCINDRRQGCTNTNRRCR